MALDPKDPTKRYSDQDLNPSNDAFDKLVSNHGTTADTSRENSNIQTLKNREENPDSASANPDTKAAAPEKDALNKYSYTNDPRQSFSARFKMNRKRTTLLGGGGTISVAVLALFMSLLPLKIPGIMDMISGEASQRIEQIAETRAKRVMARAIAQKFGTSGYVVTGEGLFSSLIATMRTNKFEEKLAAKGLHIENNGDGVRLYVNNELLGNGTLRDETAVLKALDGHPVTNKMLKTMVREEIPAWRLMKKAKFSKWLRIKYGIPRYGLKNSKESDSKKVVTEMNTEKVSQELDLSGKNATTAIGCMMDGSSSPCSLTDKEKPVDSNGKSSNNSQDLSNSIKEANDTVVEAVKEGKTLNPSQLLIDTLTKKFGTKAAIASIPVVGQVLAAVDLASMINHALLDQARTDYLGSIVSGLKQQNYAQLYGLWEGYASQNKLGELHPDFIGTLAKQTNGVEESQAFNYIEGKHSSSNPSSIPGKPVDRVEANNPGYIKKVMDESGITSTIKAYNIMPGGLTLEIWYNTIGNGGLLGWIGDKIGGFIGTAAAAITPDQLEEWTNGLIESLFLKLLKVLNLDFNPLAAGADFFNHAHAGATASNNTYCQEIGCRKLSPEQASHQNMTIAAQRSEELAEKGLWYQLFSPESTTSLTTQMAIKTSTNPASNIPKIASFVLNAPAHILNLSTQKTSAATAPYVDLYGIDPYGATAADLAQPLSEKAMNSEECPEVSEGSFNACKVDKEVMESMACAFPDGPSSCFEDQNSTTSDSSGSLLFASYNVRTSGLVNSMFGDHNSHLDESDIRRYKGIIDLMMEKKITIFATQETSRNEWRVFRDNVPSNFKSTQPVANSDVAIFWDSNLYELLDTGTFQVKIRDDGTHRPQVWAKLRHKEAGGELLVFNLHLAASEGREHLRIEGAKIAVDKIKSVVGSSGTPFILAGDMNGNDRKPSTIGAYNVFKNSGIMNYTRQTAQDVFGNHCDSHNGRAGSGRQECRRENSHGSHIDMVWTSKQPKITTSSYTLLANSVTSNLSDHNPIITDLDVPGFAVESNSSGGWVWPIQKDLKPGPCWGVNVGSLGVHAGMDINTDNENNPTLAMHSGKIIRTGYDQYAGNYIKVKTDDGKYYIYQHLKSISKHTGTVAAGEPLGIAGKTGRMSISSKAHFHVVVSTKDDFPSYGSLQGSVDPLSVLPKPAPGGYACTK